MQPGMAGDVRGDSGMPCESGETPESYCRRRKNVFSSSQKMKLSSMKTLSSCADPPGASAVGDSPQATHVTHATFLTYLTHLTLWPSLRRTASSCLFCLLLAAAPGCRHVPQEKLSVRLLSENGVPKGWLVRAWADVKNAPPEGAVWKVEQGILQGSEPRGTWLVSEREYGDFILEFEFKLGEQGNSGCGLRFPLQGDPAFDGLELQMVDPRYYGTNQVTAAELTGSLYRAVAPRAQLFKPTEWNKYEIACQGPFVKVVLNGEHILDVNLDKETTKPKRHDGTDAPALKNRPRRGHIGFQELSRGGGHVQIRNIRITELE